MLDKQKNIEGLMFFLAMNLENTMTILENFTYFEQKRPNNNNN